MTDKNMGVQTIHPLYRKRSEQWRTVRDCVEGEDTIKAAGPRYLPMQSTASNTYSQEDMDRYNAYKVRAQWINYTSQTLAGIHGMIFRRMPTMQLPEEMKLNGYLDNIDHKGNSLYQFLADSVYDLMQTGFGGFLVDILGTDESMSVEQAEKAGIKPYISYYAAESIINWKKKIINGREQLCLVVLEEHVDCGKDEFSHDFEKQYRVLDLDESGQYRQRIFCVVENGAVREEAVRKTIYPTVNNKRLDYIPFVMLPFEEPQKPILYDIARVNIGHYQKSADYENGVHLTTIPTGYITGHTPETDKDGHIQDIYLGKDAFLQIPEPDAKCGNLVFSGEGLSHCEEALEKAEQQMIVLGSRIITPEKKTSETAQAAIIHRQGEDAKLATFARNVSEKITRTVQILCNWCEYEDKVSIVLNTDYETMEFDANAVNAMANIFSQGKLPLICLYYMLMHGEYLAPDMTYDDFVYLLDLESSELDAGEVYEAYKIFKESGKQIKTAHKPYEKPDEGGGSKVPMVKAPYDEGSNDKR